MSNKSLNLLSSLIAAEGTPLGDLAREAQTRMSLTDHIRAGLPRDIADQVHGCNLRDDGTLVVIAATPEWGARLRFESMQMLALCRERFPGTTQVKIRVARESGT